MALSACNAFYMHRMAYRFHREKKIQVACILGRSGTLPYWSTVDQFVLKRSIDLLYCTEKSLFCSVDKFPKKCITILLPCCRVC